MGRGKSGEAFFFDLALDDLTRAADLFRPTYDQTKGVDGWVSLEVSPLLAYDTATTLAAAKDLSTRGARPNLFIKIPGTPEGLPAIEEAIFAGVSINVTLLFSREQYLAAAEAYLKGIERRIAAGLPTNVGSVASVFISRWDVAANPKVPERSARQAGNCHCAAHLQGLSRVVAHAPLAEDHPRPDTTRSDSCWRVRERKIRRLPTFSTSKRWLRPTRSTPCPRPR